MAKYLIRAEAASFDDFIFGTKDISAVRGGGMLLRHSLEHSGILNKLNKVYGGGSAGLFEAEYSGDIEQYCEEIRTDLQSGNCTEAIFVVAAHPWDGDDKTFPAAHGAVIARARWKQLQSPTFVLPAPGERPCELDRLRPAEGKPVFRQGAAVRVDQKKMYISSAAKVRRSYGIDKKFDHYQDIYGEVYPGQPLAYREFTNDFEQIAHNPDSRLHNKIALIHLDGNRFGKILTACANPTVLDRWSKTVEGNWNSFLAWLLSIPRESGWLWSGEVVTAKGEKERKSDAFRIETLLWGGDEILLAVPAWKGWWVMENFFKLYGTLGLNRGKAFDPLDGSGPRELTFSGSLVFAHYNAPIQRLRKLSDNLTALLKKVVRSNAFSYEVLESFDHLGNDPERARSRVVNHCALSLPGDKMAEIRKSIIELRKRIPRSRLYAALSHVREGKGLDEFHKEFGETVRRAAIGLNNDENRMLEASIQALSELSATHLPEAKPAEKIAASWLHLMQLWDYIPEPEINHGGGGVNQ